jgi:hypothetical protein
MESLAIHVDELTRDLQDFRFGPIWDGNVNSKTNRDFLYNQGFIDRAAGFQFLTAKGVTHLKEQGLLNEDTWRAKPRWENK